MRSCVRRARRPRRRRGRGRAGRRAPAPARCGAGTGGPVPCPPAAPSTRPGDVGHDELGAVAHAAHADDAQMRLQGGEGVVGDLRLGGRHGRDQGGLAGVGEADQRHVGHQLELHVQPELLALLALLGEGRGAAAVGEEARVAPAALAALGHQEPGALGRQVADAPRPSWSRTTVPTGTGTTRSLPRGAVLAWSPSRGRRRWPAGRGGRGSRAATTRSPRPRARRRRRGRRRRRRGRRGRRGPPGATRPPRLPRRRRARAAGPGRRIRA